MKNVPYEHFLLSNDVPLSLWYVISLLSLFVPGAALFPGRRTAAAECVSLPLESGYGLPFCDARMTAGWSSLATSQQF